MTNTRKLHFSTHAELKNVIGQDLINDDNIAILELVKNGIDAGATSVKISFFDSTPSGCAIEGPVIIVEDDGVGMSLSDIEAKWLNIAYSEKKDRSGDRLMAGNKGVGRFACDRLGTRLDMFTRKGRSAIVRLEVDWTAFENKRKVSDTIQRVSVAQSEVSAAQMRKLIGDSIDGSGTVLVIAGLRQEWVRNQLLQLKRNLERFVNPIAVFDRKSVKIKIEAPAQRREDRTCEPHERINGLVSNRVFENLKFKTTYIESALDETGEFLTTELFHEGQRVYRLVEKRSDFHPLKGVRVVLHYMNSYKKAYFKRQTGLHLVDFGSIFLFVNGYRVSPYGDRDNDWLQLDSRKQQGVGRFIGAREVLGFVDVRDSDTDIRIVSNREGIVRNDAHERVTSRDGLVFNALTRLERFVVDGLKWDTVPEHIRKKLSAGEMPGDASMPEAEVYAESADKKRRRTALEVLRIVGASPQTTIELDIDPSILEALAQERADDVKGLLDKFDAFESGAVGQDLKLALGRVKGAYLEQSEQLTRARERISRKDRQVERLRSVARGIAGQKEDLERQIKTQESEIMFARVTASSDREQLLLLHHQAGIYAHTAVNFLESALDKLRRNDTSKAVELVGKALNSANKVVMVANFATKANFRLKTGVLTADIVQFMEEYALNVARDGSAQDLRLHFDRRDAEPFVMRFKPIELAILFDNLASNSSRAGAKNLRFAAATVSENELAIVVEDDGRGLSSEVQPPEKIFERGVTTTSGSGLGLYHVRETIKQLGGTIEQIPGGGGGFGLRIRLFK